MPVESGTRLRGYQRHWDRLGARDPFWAALTASDKTRRRWDADAFFRSGADEIAAVLEQAERLGIAVSRSRALDFGCGAGRLTQAMAAHFERCDGVDISASMLSTARRYNRHPECCTYHLNVAPDLSLFPDASFTFVYSTLVLQHIPPDLSRRYITELVRVLTPGGLLVFQLPSHRAAEEPPAQSAETSIPGGRLPPEAFNARIAVDDSPLRLVAGRELPLKVTVENRSPHAWPARPDTRGRHRINLANHWLADDGDLLQRDDARCPLPYDFMPGTRADLMIGVKAPDVNGTYLLELDLVQENVGWFAERGSATLRVPCEVTGGRPAAPRVRAPAREVPDEPAPFRERHPRVFRVLRATRVRDAYWVWRHALDAFRSRCDRLIWDPRDRAIWWLKARAYEPVVPPLINWWRSRPFAARMDMHCVPRSAVTNILAECGARVVDTDAELMPGGFQSYRYWVIKR